MDRPTGAVSRRLFLAGLPLALAGLPLALAGCTTSRFEQAAVPVPVRRTFDPALVAMYGPIEDEPFPVEAVDLAEVGPEWLRQVVPYSGPERTGTVVVDPDDKFLYLVRDDGSAMRYGVGVGREGFGWNGAATIRRKAVWPTWTPPAAMVARDPRAAPWANGMPGGPENPLGARALYLFQGDRDTLYRIHGTNEPWTIGTAVSSGCIRMFNQDVIDLHRRTPIGSRVVVRPSMVG